MIHRLKSVLFLIFSLLFLCSYAHKKTSTFITKPFANNVFIAEHGQFKQRTTTRGVPFSEKIEFGVENGEFNAYFNRMGITFQFVEYKPIEREEEEEEGEEEGEKQKFEPVWHSVNLKFVNANLTTQMVTGEKAKEYYNYAGTGTQYNFVPAYKKIKYVNLYPGVDAEFAFAEEGGIKYQFIVRPGVAVPEIAFELTGNDNLMLDVNGNLLIQSVFGNLTDHAPTAYTAWSHTAIPVKYSLEGQRVKFQFPSGEVSSAEGLIIDPWITATTFPATNSAFDIQEDAAGNVYVQGSTSNYQIQKYDATGSLIWTYVTASIFLGDIAVDNPGNVYIIGGYSTGKRQKLDTNGVQQWQLSGLMEEWRLAFDYSKTVLTVGGYFSGGGNNLGRFDTATGVISNQINYGAETRGIATDCNGDMFSLHVTFGYSGVAATNMLRKTNANFTPDVAVPSGFLLAEAEPARGYAPNPLYGADIYQGINGLAVIGACVYIFDGASIRRFDKTSLTFLNSASVPNGSAMNCSGIAADNCGNIYAGSLNGIVQFDSALNYQQTIATPGTVYDILLSNANELLVCGAGFLGNFNIACSTPPPLSASSTTGCEGTGAVSAVPAGGIGPYTYLWQPNGETTASISNPLPGTYSYVVSDAFCHTYSDSVTVPAKPVAAFSGNSTGVSHAGVNSVCEAGAIQFTDSSTIGSGTMAGYVWNFGDGSPSDTSQNPQHIYAAAGTYAVTLIVTSSLGCSDTATVPVVVYPLPVANFSVPTFCPGVPQSFTDQSNISSGSIAGYSWNFGDGSASSTLQNPAHSYTLSNIYQVNLAVTSNNGCVDDTLQAVPVSVSPEAGFTATAGCLNGPSVFTNTSAIVGPATISSWAWDIGNDGSTEYTTPNASHTFPTGGTYDVLLTAVSSDGCVDDTLVQVTVLLSVTADFSTGNVCETAPATFTDQSTGNVAGWSWSFGDGTSAAAQNTSHTYSAAGTYSVQLTVSSSQGCVDSVAKQLTIYPVPVVDFAVAPASGCVPLHVVLNDQSSIATGNNAAWHWQMATLFSDTLPNANFNFTTYGTYPVTLTVTSNLGCTDSVTKPVTVYPMPAVDFTASPAAGCMPLSVSFSNLSSIANGSNLNCNWQIGGLATSQQPNESFNFTTQGTYPVTLTVTSENGCTDSVTKPVTVYPTPVVDFAAVPADGCVPLNITLSDLSSIATGSNVAWNWQIETLPAVTQQNAQVSFATAGNYDVSLRVTSDMGCETTLTRSSFVVAHPNPSAEFAPNPQETELLYSEIKFADLSTGNPVQWNWQFGTGDGSALQNPSYNYQYMGNFAVWLEVANQYGCTDTISHTVIIHEASTVFIPNAFTPNGDGNNDTWGVIATNVKLMELKVFDRIGEKVFETNDLNKWWDGTFKGKPLPPGVYVYVCSLVNLQNVSRNMKGSLTLLK